MQENIQNKHEYTDITIDHYLHPRNIGILPDATGAGTAGDQEKGQIMIQITLRCSNRVIEDIRFRAFGCSATIASASMVTELAKGKTLEEAEAITSHVLLEALGGLPQDKLYCADYATKALHIAIKDAISRNSDG